MKAWIIPAGIFEQGRGGGLSCEPHLYWRRSRRAWQSSVSTGVTKLHDLVGFSGPEQIPGKLSGEALMKCAHSRVQQLLFERLIKPLSLWPIIATTPIGLL